MKKFLCYLCVLCLIVSTLTCIQAPVASKADEPTAEYPATVTAIAFSDPGTWPDAIDLCEVKVTTGAAITLGGQSYWNYGMIIIEPNEGYSVTSVENEAGETFEIKTIAQVWGNVTATGMAIPYEVESKVHPLADNYPHTAAVYIPREVYNQRANSQTITIHYSNTETTQSISVLPDCQYRRTSLAAGASGDVTELFANLYGFEFVKDDYNLESYSINSTSNSAVVMDATDPYKYTVKMSGEWGWLLQNKKTGLAYEIRSELVVENPPLTIDDFRVDDGAVIIKEGNMNAWIYPSGEERVLKHLELSFELPEGATVNWSESDFGQNDVSGESVGTGTKYTDSIWWGGEDAPFTYSVLATIENNVQKITFEAEKALVFDFLIAINYDGKVFYYHLFIDYFGLEGVSVGVPGYQTYTFLPGTVMSIFDLIHVQDDSRQNFIEAVNDKELRLASSGMEFLYENGLFTGKVILYRPVDYLSIMINPVGQLCGCDINIQIKANTVATPGQNVDIRELLNGYNGSSRVEVYKGLTKIECDYLDGMTFTAPQLENDEPVIYYVKFYNVNRPDHPDEVEAIVNVTVLPEENITESIGGVIESLDDNDELVMDSKTTGGVIPKEFFVNLTNIKSQGKGNVKIKIKEKNNNNPHNVSWTFEADDIASAANADIKPGVKVNDELNDAELDRQLQKVNANALKIGFEENGKLPGKSTIRIYLTEADLAKLGNKKNIELYYFKNGKFEKESGDYYVVNDTERDLYYIEFEVTHNSEFVLSGTPIVNPTDPVTPGPSGPTGPSGPSAPVIISGGGEGDVSTPAGDTTAVEEEKKDETQKDTSAEQPEVKETPAPKVKVGDEKTSGGNTYKVTGSKKSAKTVAVSTAESNKEEVKLPAKVKIGGESYAVTEISKNTFKNNDTIKSVKTGTSIAKIGKAAFKGCDALESVNLGKNVDTIGANAFSGCGNLTSINIFSRKLTVESFGKNAFKGISKDCVFFVPKGYVKKYRAMFKELGYSFTVKMMQK